MGMYKTTVCNVLHSSLMSEDTEKIVKILCGSRKAARTQANVELSHALNGRSSNRKIAAYKVSLNIWQCRNRSILPKRPDRHCRVHSGARIYSSANKCQIAILLKCIENIFQPLIINMTIIICKSNNRTFGVL